MSSLKVFLHWSFGLFGFGFGIHTSVLLAHFLSSQVDAGNFLAAGIVSGDLLSCSRPFFFLPLWNIFLLLLFILQHTGMASQTFKDLMDQLGLKPIERSFYVVTTCVVIRWIISSGASFPGLALWDVDTSVRPLLWTFFFLLHAILWMVIFLAALGTDILDLFGIRAIYNSTWPQNDQSLLQNKNQAVRHPGMVCLLMIIWIHPTMSFQRFITALALSLYTLFHRRLKDELVLEVQK